MEKLEKDGKVAVIISPGFGAGWSTWNKDIRYALLFDPEIAQAVLDGDMVKVKSIAKRKYPSGYFGGADGLTVEWIYKGTIFDIEEYDGSESLHIIGDRNYTVA